MTVMTPISRGKPRGNKVTGLIGAVSLRTPCGARRVENMRPGDLVVTRDNGLQPVRMVWTRTVTAAEIAADPSLAPVRLKPRAIGPMMPQRDLALAGGHRILVPGWRLADMDDTESCLIAARDIAEASDVAFVDRTGGDVTYYNVVFDAHQVFCADGLPVESYLPSRAGLRQLDEAVRCDLAALFAAEEDENPAFPAPRYAAPKVKDYRPELV